MPGHASERKGAALYSAISESDGRFSFLLHVPPERLTSEHAREALDALTPLVEELSGRAGRAPPHWNRLERRVARSELLAEAGRVLLERPDVRTALRAVARVICLHLTDGCIVYLREGGRPVEVTRGYREGFRSRLQDLERWYLARGTSPGGWIDRVLRTARPQVLSDETQSPEGVPLLAETVGTARAGDGRSPLLPTPPRRAMIVPLVEPPRPPPGALVFITARDGAGYDGEDLELAGELAARCAARLRWERAPVG